MIDSRAIQVTRHPSVSVRRQIAARIEAAVREGELRPGTRLPAVRKLAPKLGVHRNTVWAAYRLLEAEGVTRATPGGGVYVREPAPVATDDLFHAYLATERAAGAGVRALEDRFERWAAALGTRRVTVVEESAGLRNLLQAEVRAGLGSGWEVGAQALSAVLDHPALLRGGIPVGRTEVCTRLRRRLPGWMEPLSLPLRGGARELRTVACLAAPAVVAVVTVSRAVRSYARELLAGYARQGISVMTPRPNVAREVERARRIAALLFVDVLCAADPRLAGNGRIVTFGCVRGQALEEIACYLGSGVGT